jgi:hypothetical protein
VYYDGACCLKQAVATFLHALPVIFYILLTVHLDVILGNDQLDALFLNVLILRLYMFRAASAHRQEGQIVLIHIWYNTHW